jgi:hypothetical protein
LEEHTAAKKTYGVSGTPEFVDSPSRSARSLNPKSSATTNKICGRVGDARHWEARRSGNESISFDVEVDLMEDVGRRAIKTDSLDNPHHTYPVILTTPSTSLSSHPPSTTSTTTTKPDTTVTISMRILCKHFLSNGNWDTAPGHLRFNQALNLNVTDCYTNSANKQTNKARVARHPRSKSVIGRFWQCNFRAKVPVREACTVLLARFLLKKTASPRSGVSISPRSRPVPPGVAVYMLSILLLNTHQRSRSGLSRRCPRTPAA